MGVSTSKLKAASHDLDLSSLKLAYSQHTGRKSLWVLILLILTGGFMLVSTSVGAAGLSVGDVWLVVVSRLGFPVVLVNELANTVVWEIRLPRILLATITGIALGGAGAVMQGVLRNPLVSPYTMGLSSGAAFGAALAIVLGTGLVGAVTWMFPAGLLSPTPLYSAG